MKVHAWSESAPNWRIVKSGLCLEGKCSNRRCKAYGQMVIMNMGIPICYQLNMPSQKPTKCPICHTYVQPVTCAFNNCMWRYLGIKQTSKGPERCKSEWANAGDSYHRFDESKNSQWTSLVLETKFDELRSRDDCNYQASTQGLKRKTVQLSDEFECAICLENTTKHETTMLSAKCSHSFHRSCLTTWNLYCSTCPVCRQ